MIRIDVEEYCHQCQDFHPDVIPASKVTIGNDEVILTDTLVKCEFRKRCSSMMRFLTNQQNRGERASG